MPAARSRPAAMVRNNSPSRPSPNPTVATNKPSTRNDTASPAASASGPSRCSDSAVPRTTGSSGSTHGERIETSPARKARPSEAIAIGGSQGLLHDGFDRLASRDAGRAHHLDLVLVDHERA